MPSKNSIKTYVEDTYYHIYNRGVEKRDIFLDEQDPRVFLHYIKLYLSPVDELKKEANQHIRILRFIRKNLSQEVDLVAFALMPNHIHLQVKQYTKDGIHKLMRRLLTSYASYFNKKYKRVGPLFQGRYKAVIIDTEPYLLHLSRYIHLNPMGIKSGKINFKEFSSYPYYLGQKRASWVKPEPILEYFRSSTNKQVRDMFSYQSFVENYREDSSQLLENLTLEEK